MVWLSTTQKTTRQSFTWAHSVVSDVGFAAHLKPDIALAKSSKKKPPEGGSLDQSRGCWTTRR
jgi:hypothetical protein